MPTAIEAKAVTSYEVSADGKSFRLSLRNDAGEASVISLPSECLNQLVMTMPCIAAEALRKRYGSSEVRLVYPLSSWSLGTTEDDSQLIFTLGTPGGFQITFAVTAGDVARITATMNHHKDTLSPQAVSLN
jgi:hypothetical protein